jgi:hypothetical protein
MATGYPIGRLKPPDGLGNCAINETSDPYWETPMCFLLLSMYYCGSIGAMTSPGMSLPPCSERYRLIEDFK